MSDDIEKLFPGGKEITAGGETLTLKPFTFGMLPRAIKLLRPVTEAVGAAGIAKFEGGNFYLAPDWPLKLPQLMDEAGEALVLFIAFAANKPRDWFDTLGADEGIDIAKAVFEVNGDFFVKRVAPKLGMSTPAVTPPAGEQSSLA